MKNLGVYVHIPFCIKKCNYCDFNSYSNIWKYENAYFDALINEIEKHSGKDDYCADTIYIGGGTPSAVNPENITRVMKALKKRFYVPDDCEATIECNPATVDYDGFCTYQEAGLNRISMGLQSANDEELRGLGRIHTFKDFQNSFEIAEKAGFSNISLDLMFGLPNQNVSDWSETLKKAAECGAKHISCYALTIEEGTPFSKMALNLPNGDVQREMYDLAVDFLKQRGYFRYEISNFAKIGYQSRHNLKYWSLDEYAGFGAGAHTFLDERRFANEKDVINYINGAPFEILQEMCKSDLMSEFMFLGLRTSCGVSENEFAEKFGDTIDGVFREPLQKYENTNVIERKNGRVFINPDYLYVSNSILCDFVL